MNESDALQCIHARAMLNLNAAILLSTTSLLHLLDCEEQ